MYSDDMKREALNIIGDQVHFLERSIFKIQHNPHASPAMHMAAMVISDCLQEAYATLDKMLNPFGAVGISGLETAALAFTMPRRDLQAIMNQVVMHNAREITLADDGQSFYALGTINELDDSRILHMSESLQRFQ